MTGGVSPLVVAVMMAGGGVVVVAAVVGIGAGRVRFKSERN